MRHPADNPYVGPRTFEEDEQDMFFGREREAKDLLSLVMSERLVLFYAQSGAGKSSLINTRLLPGLRQAGFQILPVGRVRGDVPRGVGDIENIFVFNLILNLDQNQQEVFSFTRASLSEYLGRRLDSGDAQPSPRPRALVVDQFEELFTANLEHWEKREDFFRQLRQAMEADPLLWVLLSLREDYVAALEPYARLLPGRLRTRYYMRRLGYEAALEAVERPAAQAGRPFAHGIAQRLVDNLRQIRITGEQAGIHLGEFVEPVQLQVVCYQLWQNLKEKPPSEITQQDLQELGDVDKALAQFYEQAIAETILRTGVSEIDARDWFERQLITEAGTRGMVYRGKQETGGLSNPAVDMLASKFLLRAEARSGGTWYELVHDRFIEPILQANQAWRLKQPLIQMAQAWADSGKSATKLLEGQQLQWALDTNWQGLGPMVQEFLEASQAAQRARDAAAQAEREAQRQRELEQARALAQEQQKRAQEQGIAAGRLRRLAIALFVVFLGAVAAAILAWSQQLAAQTQRQIAQAQAATAETRRVEAETAQAVAVDSQGTAQARRLEAETAQAVAVDAQGTAEARRVDSETAVAVAQQALADQQALLARLEATLKAQISAARVSPSPATATSTPSPTPTPVPPGTPAAVAVADLEIRAGPGEAYELLGYLPQGASAEVVSRDQAGDWWQIKTGLNASGLGWIRAGAEFSETNDTDNLPIALAPPTPVTTPAATPPPSPTATATASSTPTPNQAATAAAVASLQQQLVQLQATQEALKAAQDALISQRAAVSFPPPGRIAFASNRLSSADLYSMKGDGNDVIRLTRNGGFEPSYSPGSDRIVFTALRENRARLYTIPPNGGEEVNVGGTEYDNWEPAFSRDGQRIAFVSSRDGGWDIYSMNADSSDVKRLTDHPAKDYVPAWSPDRRRIAFVSERLGRPDLWVMDADGGNQVQLTDDPADDVYPTWSPDGQHISFASNRGGNLDIYVMEADGRNLRNVTNSPFDENYPAWSPDGNWLAFSRFTTNNEIFVMTIDGDHLTNLTNSSDADWAPTWIP